MSRSKRSVQTFISSSFTTLSMMVLSFISTPIILKYLGNERYGALRTASDWGAYTSIIEYGVAGGMLPVLAAALHSQNRNRLRDALSAGVRAYRIIYIPIALLLLAFIFFIDRLVPVSPDLRHELRLCAIIGLVTSPLMLLNPSRAILEVSQRGYLLSMTQTTVSAVTLGLSMFLAYAGWGMPGQSVAAVVGLVVSQVMLIRFAHRLYPDVVPSVLINPTHSPDEKKNLGRQNWPVLINFASAKLGFFTDNIVIAQMRGVASVASFSLTQKLITLAGGQASNISGSTWAALVELHATGKQDIFRTRLLELTRMIIILVFAFAVPVAAFNRAFIAIWLGKEMYGGDLLTWTTVAVLLLQSIANFWGAIFHGSGMLAKTVPMCATGAIVNLAASIVFARYVGLAGPLLGSLFAVVTVNLIWFPLLMRKYFQIPLRGIIQAMLAPLLLGALFAATLIVAVPPLMQKRHADWLTNFLFQIHVPFLDWIFLITNIAAVSVTFMLLTWIFVLRPEEKAAWMTRFAAALAKLRRTPSSPDVAIQIGVDDTAGGSSQ